MLVIGLTGGIGSGKTTVAQLFAEKGIIIIDTDQLARDAVAPGTPALNQILEHFGSALLLPTGQLDRAQLRKIVFADETQRQWLEQLLHPLIRAVMEQQITAASSPYCIAVIPLLFETSPNPLIQRTLVVDAPEEQQIFRTSQRDQISSTDAANMLRTQIDRAKRLALADDIIYNHGALVDLIPQVDHLHQIYLALR